MSNTSDSSVDRRVFEDASPVIDRLHWAVVFVIMPTVAMLGLAGNSLSILVLYRQGFKKSSNILLFALATSDIIFVIGANGPAKVLYEWGPGGFWFSERSATILYYFYHVFDFMDWSAGPMSMGLPVLITTERFFAVFFPLKFHTIVTPRRTFIATIILALLAYLPQVYVRLWFEFIYVWDPVYNRSVGIIARSDFYYRQRYVEYILGNVYAATGYFVFIVGSGTIAIGIRISLAAANRKRMVSGDGKKRHQDVIDKYGEQKKDASKLGKTSRTTKTLLTLCIFYTISCMFVAMPTFLPHMCVWPLFTLQPNFRSVEVFMYRLIQLDLCVNASCNFIIYVAMNQNFRETFLEILGKKKTQLRAVSISQGRA